MKLRTKMWLVLALVMALVMGLDLFIRVLLNFKWVAQREG